MIKLIIGNSYSRIMGLSGEQHKALAKKLSYNSGSFFAGRGFRRISLLGKRGDFPTGLEEDVRWFLVKEQEPYETIDTRIRPIMTLKYKGNFKGIIPYEDQMAAVSEAVKRRRGTIAMPTGTGKSLVIAILAHTLRVKTLVVVPSLEIKKQLIESFRSIFGPNMDSWLSILNIDSNDLKSARNFDCLIIDEAHHSAAKTYRKLNKTVWKDIYYRFFLTATPYRNDPEEELLFKSIAGEKIYELSYKDAITKGYIVPVEAYYLEMSKQETGAYTYAEVYKELVVNNEVRNTTIAMLLLSLRHKSTLCLVKELAHGNKLSILTSVDFVNGQDEESRDFIRQFNSGGLAAIIGTTGVLGEGVDTKPCEYVIIAGLGKAKSQFMQQIGRAVRRYPGKESAKVILIKDRSHKFLLRHFNAQAKILKEEFGVIPLKLEI